ncbi:helix-turn-helix transcriptional regulator [Streptomyces sp. NPDC000983]|uniref:helix-turn-helix domain-containing protein n=1 Tax=Streptomyces sp. NPDC000983 TaxID=3154373 RepID=UPI00332A21D9
MPSRAGETGGRVSAQDEVEEFAALLRRLKERTDRSYGSLARRLGMNTSTLHRYCAGDAVPQDFAPVERFAALCGASDGERVELHRRWLAAVAARQRPRGAAAEAEAAAPAAEAAPAATGNSPDADAGTDPDAGTGAGTNPGAGTATPPPEPAAQDRASTPAPAPEAPTATPAPEAGSLPEPHDATPDPAPGTASRPGGSRAGRPWYRRRRVTVAAAVGSVLLAALGTLTALDTDRGSDRAPGDRVEADAVPRTSAPGATKSPSSPSSPSPTGSGPTGRPSPSASGTPKSSPSVSSGATGAPVGGTPLTWTADSHVWAQGCGHDYVVAGAPDRVPPPPAPQDARTWATAQGAVHGRETMVRISVQGRSSTAVVLQALRVRVVGRAEPAGGSSYTMDQGCGGAVTPRYFDVNLDKDRPIARPAAGNDAGTPIPAMRLPYTVSAEDPEVLLVTARTGGCDCRWYLELDWSSQGREGTVVIGDDGRPFRTTAIEGLPRYGYDTATREWAPYKP